MNAIDAINLIVNAATPIVVAVIGMILLRRIEGVKASVAMQSDFRKKWADQFFECCQNFMVTLEREVAILTVVSGLKDPNDAFGTQLQKEISTLLPTLSELELRIRRSVVFAPTSGPSVREASGKCVALVSKLLNARQGNVDEIIAEMDSFNSRSRMAHAEMVGFAEQSTAA